MSINVRFTPLVGASIKILGTEVEDSSIQKT